MMFSWRWTVALLLLRLPPRGSSHISGDGEFDSGSGSGFEAFSSGWFQQQPTAAAVLPLIPPRHSLNQDGLTTTAASTTTTTATAAPTATTATLSSTRGSITTATTATSAAPTVARRQPTDEPASSGHGEQQPIRGNDRPTLIIGSEEASGRARCAVSFSIAAAAPGCLAGPDEARPATTRDLERVRRVVADYARVLSSVRDSVLAEAGEHDSFAGALRASLGALRADHAELELGVGKIEAAFEGDAGDTSQKQEAAAKATARMRLSLSQMSDALLKASRLHASLEVALVGLGEATREHGERLDRLQGSRTHGL